MFLRSLLSNEARRFTRFGILISKYFYLNLNSNIMPKLVSTIQIVIQIVIIALAHLLRLTTKWFCVYMRICILYIVYMHNFKHSMTKSRIRKKINTIYRIFCLMRSHIMPNLSLMQILFSLWLPSAHYALK